MADTYLNRTFGTPTNNYKWTYSVWFKRQKTGVENYLFQTYPSGEGYNRIFFKTTDLLQFDGEDTNQTNTFNFKTNRLFRDVNAWYHLVIKWDTTQATASERVKIYINGVEETSLSANTQPAQNNTYPINRAKVHNIGRHSSLTSTYFDGIMSHIHFCDGYAYDASEFGETDATTGEWKIKTSPSVSYGNNGFFILKDGNSVTDQSGNSNNWTVATGTLTNTEDNPSNVFATMNPLSQTNSNMTFSNGNTKITSASSWLTAPSTIGFTKGKWYWEVKYKQKGQLASGVAQEEVVTTARNSTLNTRASDYAHAYEFLSNGGAYSLTGNGGTGGTSITSDISENDIIMFAFDATNGALWVGNNGTWLNSATKSEIEAGTTTNAIYSSMSGANDKTWFVVGSPEATGNGATHGILEFNFGNGYFGTTAVSSAGTNASGIGIFEYDVPTGYTALSTKGLNE